MKKTFFRTLLLMALLAFFPALLRGQEAPIEIPLWKGAPPTDNGLRGPEQRTPEGFITNVSVPTMTLFRADPARNTGMAVLIAPGGGYGALAFQHEGIDFARWLAANGITGVVLKYRLPNTRREVPLDDAKQAMRLLREGAAGWGIDPARVGVMGFSAGGHLASTLLTHFDAATRPDFGVLVYPVVTFDEKMTHRGSVRNLLGPESTTASMRLLYSNEKQVSDATPPTLIFFSDDDRTVPTPNGTLFYNALKAHNIAGALYVFPSGGHGWGFRDTFRYHEVMKQLLMDWLVTREK